MQTRPRIGLLIIIMILLAVSIAGPSWSSTTTGSPIGQDLSNGTAPLLVIGELGLLMDKKAGKAEAVQGIKALIANEIITESLKAIVREKRPNSNSLSSFPSGHTSAAFTLATVISTYHPKLSLLAYGTATAIGWSRVNVGAHHWQDVVAGAALGYMTAKHFTNQHLTITPSGVGVNWRF